MSGVIVYLHADRGWGRLRLDGMDDPLFFCARWVYREVRPFELLSLGDRVEIRHLHENEARGIKWIAGGRRPNGFPESDWSQFGAVKTTDWRRFTKGNRK